MLTSTIPTKDETNVFNLLNNIINSNIDICSSNTKNSLRNTLDEVKECSKVKKDEIKECLKAKREQDAENVDIVDNFVDIVDNFVDIVDNSVNKAISILTHKYASTMDVLDIEACINLGLYKAYTTYKEGGNFAGYFYKVANNEILMEYRRQQRKHCLSYDTNEVFHAILYKFNPSDNIDAIYDMKECLALAKEFTSKCSKQVNDVISLMLKGYTQKQVCDTLGIAQSSVTRCKKTFRNKFLDAYPEYLTFLKEI